MSAAPKRLSPEIHKFGGASLADAAAFKRAAGIVTSRPGPRAVVCSAPSGVTDGLLGLARRARSGQEPGLAADSIALRRRYQEILQGLVPTKAARKAPAEEIDRSFDELDALLTSLLVLKELTPRTSDFIAARGERLSALLFVAALEAAGEKARYVDAVEVIITDGPYGGASPNLMLTDMEARKVLRPQLDKGIIPVVPGFMGAVPATEDDDPGTIRPAATLGRGGTDLTATLLARALGAREVLLWKDVPGLLTADPRVVANARVIPQLHVREAAELAYFGAKVLHPRALIPVAGRNIPVYVRPFGDPRAPGTEISGRRTLDRYPVKALSAMGGQALVTVAGNGMLGVPGIAARTFSALFQEGISISLISQSSSEQSICFSVPEVVAKKARDRLSEVFREEIAREEINRIEVRGGLSTLAVVGLGMAGHPGIAARVFRALADIGINIVAIAQGSSELNISFVVAGADAARAQQAIHDAFQLSKIGGGAVAGGEHVDVVLLGFGQIGRSLAEMIAKSGKDTRGSRENTRGGRASNPRVRIVGAIDRSGYVFDADGFSAREVSRADVAEGVGARVRAVAGRPGGEARRRGRGAGQARAVEPDAGRRHGRRHHGDGARSVARGDGRRDGEQAPAVGTARVARRAARAGRPRGPARPVRGDGRGGAADPRHAPQAGRVGRPGHEDRGLRVGDAGLSADRDRAAGAPFSDALRRAMDKGYTEPDPRDDLSGADVGRKALILGRLLGFAGEPEDVAGRVAGPRCLPPPAAARVSGAPGRAGQRVGQEGAGRARQGGRPALRGDRDQEPDRRRLEGRRRVQSVFGAEGHRQPDRVRHGPLPPEPAGRDRPGRGPGGDRGRRVERHPGPGRVSAPRAESAGRKEKGRGLCGPRPSYFSARFA